MSIGFAMSDTSLARLNMVESQVRPNGITDHRILDAMMAVQREDFVPDSQKSVAYMDEDIVLSASSARYLMEPMALARMVQLAEIAPDNRVLLVGAATGYGAAVVSHIAGHVVALESDEELVARARENLAGMFNVTVVQGALEAGHGVKGSFDVVLIEGRIAAMPDKILALLKSGGRAVAVLGERDVSKCYKWTVEQGQNSMRSAFDLSIPALPGFVLERAAFVF